MKAATNDWGELSLPDHQLGSRILDRALATLEVEMNQRLDRGLVKLDPMGSEALVLDVIGRELRAIDAERVAVNGSRLTAQNETELTNRVLAMTLGLGPVQLLLADKTVEEIIATRWDLIFVYRSDGSIELLDRLLWPSESAMADWLAHEARTAGRTERQFNGQRPLLVMRIGDGLRLAAHRDIAQHVGFALRRNTLGNVTLDDLLRLGMLPLPIADLLRAVMRSTEMRVVFAGPTGSGKTTMARACLHELPREKHLVVIEDTAELDMFHETDHPCVDSWERREPNAEGEGAVTMQELVPHALRARPDWLVVGEVRDADSSVPMVNAMTHGQSSLTTVHAPDAVGALDKLAVYLGTGNDKLPITVAHHQLSMAVDFVVHVDRLPDGRRYVTEVIEIEGFDGDRCTVNTLYTHGEPGREGLAQMTDRRRRKLAAAGFDAGSLRPHGVAS